MTKMSYVLACVLFVLVNSSVADDPVATTYGPVKGLSIELRTGKRLVKFLGIPYANASRFEPPRKATTWNRTFLATKFGKSCPQQPNIHPFNVKAQDMSEFCLNLNIFAPNTTEFQNKRASYPVLVMLHGGGFILGGGFMFDGSALATEGNIVVVTINYRLGALGFFSLGEDGLDGNYALLDVIESLRWVKDNIKRFGGDPNKVTLGGWSAGSRLVSILMLSPLASGLYHKVILMSGHAGAHYSYMKQDEAKQNAWYFGGLLRCPHPSSDFKSCMKRRSTDDFIREQANMYPSSILANWAPVVDGKVLPDSPPKLLDEGRFNSTSILTGVASDDASSFLGRIPGINDGVDVAHGLTRENFIHAISKKVWLRQEDKKVPEIIEFVYTDWSKSDDVNTTRRGYLDLLTDSMYRAPAVQSVNAFAKKQLPVYFYQFEYRATYDSFGKRVPSWMNVPHGAELQYIFPKPTMDSISGITKTMIDYWVNFITKGDPTNPAWPKYDIKSQKFMAMRSFPAVESRLRPNKMAFWNSFLPKTGRADLNPPRAKHRYTGDVEKRNITTALIVVSCLFAIFIIIFIAVVGHLVIKLKRNQSSTAKDNKAYPVPRKDETDFKSSPVHSSNHNQSPMYNNSFKATDKEPYPPYPQYQNQPENDIEFVDQRYPVKEHYMESDML